MSFIKSLFRAIYCFYAFLTFLVTMFLILPFVVIASFFGKINGGNAIFFICSIWGDIWFFLIGIYHRNIYDAPHDKLKQFIFVSNHISYLDAPIIVKTIRQPVRVLGKSEMSKIPFFGFIYKNAIVTVDRSDSQNRSKSVRILKSVVRKGISIFIFPEGTFNETGTPLKEFYDGAFRIAIETQTDIKPVLFLDSYSRMNYKSIFSLSPGRSRAVFLKPVSVEGLQMKDLNLLKDSVYRVMEVKLQEFNASWIKGESVEMSIRHEPYS